MRRSRVHHDPGPPESRVVALSRRVRGARPERERDVHARADPGQEGRGELGFLGRWWQPGKGGFAFSHPDILCRWLHGQSWQGGQVHKVTFILSRAG